MKRLFFLNALNWRESKPIGIDSKIYAIVERVATTTHLRQQLFAYIKIIC